MGHPICAERIAEDAGEGGVFFGWFAGVIEGIPQGLKPGLIL
jgi:hypothetical protein